MLFPMSDRAQETHQRVSEFMDTHVYAAEAVYAQQLDGGPSRWAIPPVMEELKAKAKTDGLWNLFLPKHEYPRRVSPIWNTRRCARSWDARRSAPEVFNCSAPDTGNMETLVRYGTAEQKNAG